MNTDSRPVPAGNTPDSRPVPAGNTPDSRPVPAGNTPDSRPVPAGIGPIVTTENPALAEQMRRHHFRRMFQYLRIEACTRRNDAPDLADEAKKRAAYHGHLARSIRLPKK